MRVLVACEYSGRVRDAFTRKGHHAVSCDLLPTESPGFHRLGDVREIIESEDWDLMIAHPPCTYLTVAQAWTFYHPHDKHLPRDQRRPHPKFPDRMKQKQEAIEFVKLLWNAPIEWVAIENPIGFLSTEWKKPTQIIQPWQFGHEETKSTCLWLRGLPPLKPTKIMETRNRNITPSGQNKLGPSPDRWKIRSLTYTGVANAMADQWG